MPRPRKYLTNAERFRAYRQRKKERERELIATLNLLTTGRKRGRKGAGEALTIAINQTALCRGLLELRKEITRRREEAKAKRHQRMQIWADARRLFDLVDYIENELDRLTRETLRYS